MSRSKKPKNPSRCPALPSESVSSGHFSTHRTENWSISLQIYGTARETHLDAKLKGMARSLSRDLGLTLSRALHQVGLKPISLRVSLGADLRPALSSSTLTRNDNT